jgi:hypothetical protein
MRLPILQISSNSNSDFEVLPRLLPMSIQELSAVEWNKKAKQDCPKRLMFRKNRGVKPKRIGQVRGEVLPVVAARVEMKFVRDFS